MFPPPPAGTRKHEAKRLRVLRAMDALGVWAEAQGITAAPSLINREALPTGKRRRRNS